ncbi:MAG TPA: TadE/TadG family type IV pilus assembly protein [Bryobacteraceae bacterium]
MMQDGRDRERGSSAIEFAFCSLILVPLLLGGLSVGFNLVRATQVAQFTRDAGHQYAYGIDFTQASGQQLLVTLASGLNFQLNGGTGVAIFSTILMVGPNDCTSGGLQANTGSCPNLNRTVFTRWYKVGNTGLYSSTFGSPTTANTTTGVLSSSSYLKDSSARANGIVNLITLTASQSICLTEVYFASSDYNITGFLTGNGVYARAIF